jgi:hypothetical protein
MEGGFWDSYKFVILAGVTAAVIAGVYFWFRWQFAQKEKKLKKQRLQYRLDAQRYAGQLAKKQIDQYVKSHQGARHDVSDPGVADNMSCTTDFETNQAQRCIPTNSSKTTDYNSVGTKFTDDEQDKAVDDEEDEAIDDDEEEDEEDENEAEEDEDDEEY